ncbi:hypothetical protein BDF14DRAFT_1763886 [Spinellus fusiger]|nr:hypothetical protein BDF14DRAFT_1763886 [Spinellus fusiger]
MHISLKENTMEEVNKKKTNEIDTKNKEKTQSMISSFFASQKKEFTKEEEEEEQSALAEESKAMTMTDTRVPMPTTDICDPENNTATDDFSSKVESELISESDTSTTKDSVDAIEHGKEKTTHSISCVEVKASTSTSTSTSADIDAENDGSTVPTAVYTEEMDLILETVMNGGEKHLFSEAEIEIFNTYQGLSVNAKHLIVRLCLRVNAWHRASKLKYHDNPSDLSQAIGQLCDVGFAYNENYISDNKEFISYLTIPELVSLAKKHQIPLCSEDKQLKSRIINAIEAHLTSTTTMDSYCGIVKDQQKKAGFLKSVIEQTGPCVRINQETYECFHRLMTVYYRITHLKGYNPMQNAILGRTNTHVFPKYKICRSKSIWNSRDDFLDYIEALRIYSLFQNQRELFSKEKRKCQKTVKNWMREHGNILLLDAWKTCYERIELWEHLISKAKEKQMKMPDRTHAMSRFDAASVYTHMFISAIKLLSTMKMPSVELQIIDILLDQNLYYTSMRGYFHERRILLMLSQKGPNKKIHNKNALAACISAIQDRHTHQKYHRKIHKKINDLEIELGISWYERHDFSHLKQKPIEKNYISGKKIKAVSSNKRLSWCVKEGEVCTVEEVALDNYHKQGYKGIYSENTILTTLFMLLFWDIIFAPIPGAFETAYQKLPLDFYSEVFYISRCDMINQRVEEISQGQHLGLITEVFEREKLLETACIEINWNLEPQDMLEIAESIGSSGLAYICKLMAEDFRNHKMGMPDLCCWNYEEKTCLFVEVKGPNDFLSDAQKVWLDLLTTQEIPVEVCYVRASTQTDITASI